MVEQTPVWQNLLTVYGRNPLWDHLFKVHLDFFSLAHVLIQENFMTYVPANQ